MAKGMRRLTTHQVGQERSSFKYTYFFACFFFFLLLPYSEVLTLASPRHRFANDRHDRATLTS